MLKPRYATISLCLGLLAGTASAQITSIGEFPGTYQEVFLHELPILYLQPCMEGGVFGGTATLCAVDITTNQQGMWLTRPVTTGHGCDPGCSLFAKEPPQLFFSNDGAAVFEFDDAASRFGGYFGAVCDFVVNTGGTIIFYDESENVIDELTMEFATCGAWVWSGWESTVPIKKIRIESVHEFMAGGNILMDDLRYDPADTTSCYANCNGSTAEPVLTVDDFTCFINQFAAAQSLPTQQQVEHYANCNGSTAEPVLTVDDFTCFINAFAAGCP